MDKMLDARFWILDFKGYFVILSSIKYPASSIQHPVSSIQYQVSSIKYLRILSQIIYQAQRHNFGRRGQRRLVGKLHGFQIHDRFSDIRIFNP